MQQERYRCLAGEVQCHICDILPNPEPIGLHSHAEPQWEVKKVIGYWAGTNHGLRS